MACLRTAQLRKLMGLRVGIGYDVHRLAKGRPLMLGGIEIAHTHGLLGHSDADVLLHAIIDAMLGAAALGDIGHHFPDTDSDWKGADSTRLLHIAAGHIRAAGYGVANVDATVVLEQPHLQPHIPAMRSAIAGALRIETGRVSVKATTHEKLGPIGRAEGIAAWAVCLLEKL